MPARTEKAAAAPIAIVGVGCRFPGASGPAEFWRLLAEGVNAVSEVPPDRWDVDELYDPQPSAAGKMNTRWGGFLDRVDGFDAAFFRISPREAERMDPQQRLLLEVAWEALEDAGQTREALAGSATGVFVGISNDDYARLQLSDPNLDDAYAGTGSALSIAANRLSYWFDLRGPSLAIDTACSSSLVAVHLACRSLRNGECGLALAGGVNLILTPAVTVNFSKAGFMAPDGICKAFDRRADGYVRGEGAGVVVLKPLDRAIADRDPIYAVIRGSAVNQDGRTNGLTAPNRWAQEAVLRASYRDAGVPPGEVGLVEAHGTGTALGDPIEARALGAVLSEGRTPGSACALGSVKTNFGHLEAAAGIAGLIKVALALTHGALPPSLHFRDPNPLIPFEELSLRVQTEIAAWPAGSPRYAGVSAFGFGGTNAHVVLEGPPAAQPSAEQPGPHVLPLSARSPVSMQRLAASYAGWLRDPEAGALGDICFTAAVRRTHHAHRLAVTAASLPEMVELLDAFASGRTIRGVSSGEAFGRPRLVFVFAGQGGQWSGMGRRLLETQPVFRASIERTAAALTPHLDWSLLSELESGDRRLVDDVAVVQPALFAIQVALAELWRSWGVEPDAVVGQSLGEVAAAHVAGAISLEDAARIIALRSRLLSRIRGLGGMVAVELPAEAARAATAGYEHVLQVAVSNSPSSSVLSGERGALAEVVAALEARNVWVRPVKVDVAAHSPQVAPLGAELQRALASLTPGPPTVPFHSTVTAGAETELGADYWARNLCAPVLFAEAVEGLARQGRTLFLELGPHPVLLAPVREILEHAGRSGSAVASLRHDVDEERALEEAAGELYCNGRGPDWARLQRHGRCVQPPFGYPWERERFWLRDAMAPAPAEVPSEVAGWDAALQAGRVQSAQGPIDLELASMPERLALLDRAATAAMVATLRSLGAFSEQDHRHDAGSLARELGLAPGYRKLIARWLAHLAAQGVLTQKDGLFAGRLPDLRPDWEGAVSAWGESSPLPEYLERCDRLLPAILRGEAGPLETLFPGGSMATADFLYRDWSVPRYFNAIARAVVEVLARGLPRGRKFNVLEVGAGSGGATAALLAALPPAQTRYVFTDVSDFFLRGAQARFASHPFVEYGQFDVESPPAGQGFATGTYDLVIAANVLHATREVGASLENLRSLLKPAGCLLLYETTSHPAWFDISVGLIEGWQKFDDDLRQDNPLLTAAEWIRAVEGHGFEGAAALPEPGSPAAILGQHVIVARAAGATARAVEAAAIVTARLAPPPVAQRRLRPAAPDLLALTAAERQAQLEPYLEELVRAALRLPAGSAVDPQQRLDELGFDSLMAVELVATVEAELKARLPVTSFRAGVSISRLGADVLERLPPAGPVEASAREAASDVLVSIQPSGDRTPFFCVTAGYGDLLSLQSLAAVLGPEQPFYGLQPRADAGGLSALAAEYAAAMRSVQPDGPYQIGGYCSGGIVAQAVAARLIAEGAEVRRLVLLDSPWVYSHLDHATYRLLGRLLKGRLHPPRAGDARLYRIVCGLFTDDGLAAHLKLIAGYVPWSYPGRVTLFLARRSIIRWTPAHLAWRAATSGRLEVRFVPGDHDNFLRGARVQGLAAQLRDALD